MTRYGYDNVGSTRYHTKDNGQSYAELDYDVWGRPVSQGMLLNNDNGVFVFAQFTHHIYDTVLDIYFTEARFYDAKYRQWLSSDPMKDGLNWYQYVRSNPSTYQDPWGLKKTPVDIKEYASSRGATNIKITASKKDGYIKITLTYSGETKSIEAKSKNNKLDPTLLDAEYGFGKDAISVSETDSEVIIRARIKIIGDARNQKIESKDGKSSYAELVVSGLLRWQKNSYGEKKPRVTIDEITNPKRKDHEYVTIEIVKGTGTSNVSYGGDGWSKDNVGYMTLFTCIAGDKPRTADDFEYVAAHEFGHNLGLKDAYYDYRRDVGFISADNDLMRVQNGKVTNRDIYLVLIAHKSQDGEQQYFVVDLEYVPTKSDKAKRKTWIEKSSKATVEKYKREAFL